MTNSVVYLYGFVPADAPTPPRELTGVGGGKPELLPVDTFNAVCARLDAAEFSTAALEPHLSDLGWVAERGLEHERVVAWFVDRTVILPAPLFTMFSSSAALLIHGARDADTIRDRLERFTGLREWDLKVGYDADRLARHAAELSEEIAGLDRQIEAAGAGHAYLLRKQRAEIVKERLADLARNTATELYADLKSSAREARTLELPRARADLPVVLHAALLVEARSEAGLAETVARRAAELDGIGVAVRYSGPWAPYRFIEGGPVDG